MLRCHARSNHAKHRILMMDASEFKIKHGNGEKFLTVIFKPLNHLQSSRYNKSSFPKGTQV